MKILYWLGLSILSGLLFRWGGRGGFPYAKAIRRFGCAGVFLALFTLLRGQFSPNLPYLLAYVVTFGLSAWALGTYCSEINDPHDDVDGIEWFLSSFLYGLVALPLTIIGIHWYMILARSLILAITICWLRTRSSKVFVEETGSGILYVLSTPLLFL